MGRKKQVIDEKEINIEFEFVGNQDIYEFFNKKAIEIIEKINKL